MTIATLEISPGKARNIYPDAGPQFKELLEDTFGREFFQEEITHNIKTFEDALKATGRPPLPDFSNVPANMRDYFEGHYQMAVITEALNEGWVPNWTDKNEAKVMPIFIIDAKTSKFKLDYISHTFLCTINNNGFVYRTGDIATYAAKQFIDIWNKILMRE